MSFVGTDGHVLTGSSGYDDGRLVIISCNDQTWASQPQAASYSRFNEGIIVTTWRALRPDLAG